MMHRVEGGAAYHQLKLNMRAKTHNYPTKDNTVQFNGIGFTPKINPKFNISKGNKIFTIGSCFAREIESVLVQSGYDIPVTSFKLAPTELLHVPATHALNEYSVGTIAQRIERALGDFTYSDDCGVERDGTEFRDLLLHRGMQPVGMERLLYRRGMIDDLYQNLKTADLVIITLGLTECWLDTKHDTFLNSAPPYSMCSAETGRFYFQRMDVDDVLPKLQRIMTLLSGAKVLLTVSPVPLEATFTPDNCILSTYYSKSTLRVCAEIISKQFDHVDYFPSYEMAMSTGTAGFSDDNVHVNRNLVSKITEHMLRTYEV